MHLFIWSYHKAGIFLSLNSESLISAKRIESDKDSNLPIFLHRAETARDSIFAIYEYTIQGKNRLTKAKDRIRLVVYSLSLSNLGIWSFNFKKWWKWDITQI